MAPQLPLLRLASFAVLALACCGIQNALGGSENDADQAEILNCVKSVRLRGPAENDYTYNPGFIDMNEGNKGFPLLKNNNNVVAAGGRIGKGRVFAAGHPCFFQRDDDYGWKAETAMFLENVLYWVSNGKMDEIAIVPEWTCGDKHHLEGGFKKVTVLRDQSEIATTSANVILIDGDFKRDYDSVLIKRAYEEGKGILILASNFNYIGNYINVNHFNTNWGPNIVAREVGFMFRYNRDRSSSISLDSAASNYKCVQG